MRKIIAPVFISLDGVMQAPGGPEEDTSGGFAHGGWLVPHFDGDLGAAIGGLFDAPFALLLGRKTYDIFAAHWPEAARQSPDEGDRALGERFNQVTKYVATHRPESLSWENTEALGDDVVARLRKLKQSDGAPIVVQGSSELLQTLFAADLVDELRLMIFPVLLGKGKRLFGSGTIPVAFELARSRTSAKGVLIASYERAGSLPTGSFALERPTEDELARREAMKRET